MHPINNNIYGHKFFNQQVSISIIILYLYYHDLNVHMHLIHLDQFNHIIINI